MKKNDLLERLSQLVAERKSFQAILADGVVDEQEILTQAEAVQKLIERLEKELSATEFELVSELIAELSVLQVILQLKH